MRFLFTAAVVHFVTSEKSSTGLWKKQCNVIRFVSKWVDESKCSCFNCGFLVHCLGSVSVHCLQMLEWPILWLIFVYILYLNIYFEIYLFTAILSKCYVRWCQWHYF